MAIEREQILRLDQVDEKNWKGETAKEKLALWIICLHVSERKQLEMIWEKCRPKACEQSDIWDVSGVLFFLPSLMGTKSNWAWRIPS